MDADDLEALFQHYMYGFEVDPTTASRVARTRTRQLTCVCAASAESHVHVMHMYRFLTATVHIHRSMYRVYVYSCMRAFQGADGGSHVCLHCYRIFSFGYIVQGLQLSIYVGLVMVIQSALVRSHQSTSAGSFGLVRPTWIRY